MLFRDQHINQGYRNKLDKENGKYLKKHLEYNRKIENEVAKVLSDTFQKRLKFSESMSFDFYILESEEQLKKYFNNISGIDFDLFTMKLVYFSKNHKTEIVIERKSFWNVPLSKIFYLFRKEA